MISCVRPYAIFTWMKKHWPLACIAVPGIVQASPKGMRTVVPFTIREIPEMPTYTHWINSSGSFSTLTLGDTVSINHIQVRLTSYFVHTVTKRGPVPCKNGGERGIRTLERAFTRYSLSRRAPSANSAISPSSSKQSIIKRVYGGGSRIRTHGTSRYSGFQDRRLKPLGHPSP